eukprot:2840786-Prymnesium_polylepis.1
MHLPSPPPAPPKPPKGQRLDCCACRKGVATELSLRPDRLTVFVRLAAYGPRSQSLPPGV